MQQIGNATPVNTADTSVNKIIEVPQDEPLRQQQFKTIGRHPRQHAGYAQAAVQGDAKLKAFTVGYAAPCGTLISVASTRSGTFNKAIRVRQNLLCHTR